jgi:uncharacterized membrane protein/mono/diheme cytochrome c family protein
MLTKYRRTSLGFVRGSGPESGPLTPRRSETLALALTILMACIGLVPFAARGAEAEDAEAIQTTAAVFQFFESKCNDCHGAHLTKPKGKFGYVMDLKRVGENEDWVSGSDPAKSELFRLVNEDEMPGKDSDYGVATPAEKLALRRWIQLGAPTALPKDMVEHQSKLMAGHSAEKDPADPKPGVPAVPGAGGEGGGGEPPPQNPGSGGVKGPKPFYKKLLGWVGKFHAASTHFPVALLSVTLLAELVGWWTKKDGWLACTRFLLFIGAPSAVGTAFLGWVNDYSGVSASYQWHKWLGTGVAVWALLSLGSAVFFECREGSPERTRLRGTLLLGALLVSVTGFLGGVLTFGADHYKW